MIVDDRVWFQANRQLGVLPPESGKGGFTAQYSTREAQDRLQPIGHHKT